VKGRDTIEISHPPGEEIHWDWFERRQEPWGPAATDPLARFEGHIRARFDDDHNLWAKANRPPRPQALAEAARLLGAEGRGRLSPGFPAWCWGTGFRVLSAGGSAAGAVL
jgi:hypothetical protein